MCLRNTTLLSMLVVVSAGLADEVIKWNNVALDAIRATSTPPPRASRALAMVQTAVYDAVNAIDRKHKSYRQLLPAADGASADAAAAQAAYTVLKSLFPGVTQQSAFDAALASSLSSIPDGASEDDGVALGKQSAEGILALRANDNSTLVVPYTPGSSPGDWRPTPAGFAPALLPNWPMVKPWVMSSGSQFTTTPPPVVGSPEYLAAYNEVKSLGEVGSVARTAEETDIARFWADGAGTATPPGHWNLIAQDVSTAVGLSLAENARLFALLNLATADAAISSWDHKYTYNFWRPVTAIRETELGSTWTPLLSTPPFPAYTSGHSTFSGAASTILAEFLGSDLFSFTTDAEGFVVPGRSFASFSGAADEAGRSRIVGGIHFEFDNQVGLAAGRSIGQLVYASELTPIPEVSPLWLTAVAGTLAAVFRGRRRA